MIPYGDEALKLNPDLAQEAKVGIVSRCILDSGSIG